MLAVGAAIVAAESPSGDGESDEAQRVAGVVLTDVAERVEAIRGHEFEERPEVNVEPQEQLEETLERLERRLAREEPERVAAVERASATLAALLALGGVLDDEREVARLGGAADLEAGGIYVARRAEIYLAREDVGDGRQRAETILAHELAHALDDQRFPGFDERLLAPSDAAIAERAVREGSATIVEGLYSERHLGARSVERAIERRERAARRLDAALRPLVTFAYVAGARFVQDLTRREDGWRLVDRAQREPPETTEQILHPERWIGGEGAAEPPRPGGFDALGSGWRRLGDTELGELHTLALLSAALPDDEARRAAEGWGSGRLAVRYRGRPPEAPCRARCRAGTAAALAWRWDSERDARELAAAARRYVERGLDGEPLGDDRWRIRGGGAVALAVRGPTAALAFAPSPAAAAAIAGASTADG